MNKRQIIFWIVIAILVIGFGFYLKYSKLGATIVTVLTGLAGVALGWALKMLYDKYIKKGNKTSKQ